MSEAQQEYQAAIDTLAVCDRGNRGRLSVTGRAPVETLSGVLTGAMPAPPTTSDDGVSSGHARYSAVLTAKGKMVADLRAMWGSTPEESLLLDVPAPALEPLLAHLRRYVPPRLAAVEDVTEDTGLLTVLGPQAAARLADLLLVPDGDANTLEALEDNEYLVPAGPEGDVRIVWTLEVDTPAWDVFTSAAHAQELLAELVESGASAISPATWDTLRIEAGRPAFGQDMDDSTILFEAGIVDRAVDHSKGCYTGQEVIVRIRDRGHVNRLLRGLRLENPSPPNGDTELFLDGRSVGHLTSVAESPRYGLIALGYVRREVEVGGLVVVGAPDGPVAEVRELQPRWAARTGS